MLIAAVIFINEYFFVADLIAMKKLTGSYLFWPDFIPTLILSAFSGLVGGYFLVFKMYSRYRQRSFLFGVINSGLLFIVLYIVLAVIGLFTLAFIYFLFQMDVVAALLKSLNNLLLNLNTPSFFITMIIWGLLVSGTQFMLQVNDKFGQGVLWKFITGKYYHPREEERIFMFLDLKSSTTIAEKIGNKYFFELMRDVFQDITEPIIQNLGEIYQYVGDEVVISWPVEKGLKENNCLQCFFQVARKLEERKLYYLEKYDLIPSFKAGLHIGEAMVGEIGVIKKDIVFSGDVLNTTSRIQGLCNNYKAEILISSNLLQRLQLNGQFQSIPIGEIELRGKEEKVALNTVEIKTDKH
ncbi:MAG: hypothetical protein DHS20C18_25430 [Saprospiraceae bacterium]|nr:MAG: hypothetical protein DHS20C18_25430 [Saprospiraceae bacterium]